MLHIKEVKPGQRVTVKYYSPVVWQRKTDNPYIDKRVETFKTVSFSACGPLTYDKRLIKEGMTRGERPSWHIPAPELGECVHIHKVKFTQYLAGCNHNYLASQYYIDGKPATEQQTQEIKSFLETKQERPIRGLDFQLWTLDKLVNAVLE